MVNSATGRRKIPKKPNRHNCATPKQKIAVAGYDEHQERRLANQNRLIAALRYDAERLRKQNSAIHCNGPNSWPKPTVVPRASLKTMCATRKEWIKTNKVIKKLCRPPLKTMCASRKDWQKCNKAIKVFGECH
jgi:hypothetical protein